MIRALRGRAAVQLIGALHNNQDDDGQPCAQVMRLKGEIAAAQGGLGRCLCGVGQEARLKFVLVDFQG